MLLITKHIARKYTHTHTHTHRFIYLNILIFQKHRLVYMYMCMRELVWVCVRVCGWMCICVWMYLNITFASKHTKKQFNINVCVLFRAQYHKTFSHTHTSNKLEWFILTNIFGQVHYLLWPKGNQIRPHMIPNFLVKVILNKFVSNKHSSLFLKKCKIRGENVFITGLRCIRFHAWWLVKFYFSNWRLNSIIIVRTKKFKISRKLFFFFFLCVWVRVCVLS